MTYYLYYYFIVYIKIRDDLPKPCDLKVKTIRKLQHVLNLITSSNDKTSNQENKYKGKKFNKLKLGNLL